MTAAPASVRRARIQGRPCLEVCGTLDEAVAALGLARASLQDDVLQTIVLDLERGLFVAAPEVAANLRARNRLVAGRSLVTMQMTSALEQTIDQLVAEHPLRPAFVLPGATPGSAALAWRAPSCAAPSVASSPSNTTRRGSSWVRED